MAVAFSDFFSDGVDNLFAFLRAEHHNPGRGRAPDSLVAAAATASHRRLLPQKWNAQDHGLCRDRGRGGTANRTRNRKHSKTVFVSKTVFEEYRG